VSIAVFIPEMGVEEGHEWKRANKFMPEAFSMDEFMTTNRGDCLEECLYNSKQNIRESSLRLLFKDPMLGFPIRTKENQAPQVRQ